VHAESKHAALIWEHAAIRPTAKPTTATRTARRAAADAADAADAAGAAGAANRPTAISAKPTARVSDSRNTAAAGFPGWWGCEYAGDDFRRPATAEFWVSFTGTAQPTAPRHAGYADLG